MDINVFIPNGLELKFEVKLLYIDNLLVATNDIELLGKAKGPVII